MKTNNKTRANRWEREASRLLSLWVSNGERKDLFWRTNSSGAKGTVTKEKNHCGDIVSSDPAGMEFAEEYHIEAKWKKDFSYADLGTLRKWITIEGGKAKTLGKSLLMLVKGKGGEIYIITEEAKRTGLRRWYLSTGENEHFIYNGYAVFRVPPPMSMDEIDAEVKAYRREQYLKEKG